MTNDPVFGPPLVGSDGDRRDDAPAPARASMLVNVSFRVILADPASALADEQLRAHATSAMQGAVLHAVSAAPGAFLDGPVQVTARVARD